jgi:hypothetical protein
MKQLIASVLVLLNVVGCASPDHTANFTDESPVVATDAVAHSSALRRTYWPTDYKVEKSDTILPGREHYQVSVVTACLNDSAVVNPLTEDARQVLDVSHNYQSDLYVARGRKPWLHERLTKALFQDNPVAKGLGPWHEWVLSRTSFLSYQHGQFRFYTRLGIPDSDIFVEAEVALIPTKGLHVVSVREQESTE